MATLWLSSQSQGLGTWGRSSSSGNTGLENMGDGIRVGGCRQMSSSPSGDAGTGDVGRCIILVVMAIRHC